MIEEKAEVAFNRRLTSDTWLMGLRAAAISGSARPGQFVMVRVRKGVDPLLRRPFSICLAKGDLFLLLYRVVGKGTESMAREIAAGDMIPVLGPLGKGFRLPEKQAGVLLVAGGIGIAPLLFLAQRLGRGDFSVMAGFGSAGGVIPVQEVLDLAAPLQLSTDDGSEGHHGPVTDLLDRHLREQASPDPLIFACGPHGMLRSVARMAIERKISCQISMESSMACGMGACLGCVVRAAPGEKQTYYHVCSDGPVFDAPMIDWG